MKFELMKTSGLFHDRFPYVSHIFEVPLFRKLTIMCLIVLNLGSLVNVIILCQKGDVVQMTQNGLMLVICSFATHVFILTLLSTLSYPEFLELKKEMWSSNEGGPGLKRKIENDIRLHQFSRIFLTILCILSSLFLLPISGDIREGFGILYIFDDFYSKPWSKHVIYPLKLIQMFLSAAFPSPCFMMIYAVGDCTYGIMILREKIKLIEKTFGTKDILVHDPGYQKYVEIMLKRCLEQHVLIKEYFSLISKVLQDTMLVAFFTFVAIVALLYFNCIWNFRVNLMVRGSSMSIIIMVFIYNYCKLGQKLQDQCEEFYRDLCECPWYLWNRSNKSLYSMFLIHAEKPLLIHSVDISLNFSILVKLTRTAVSMLTAVRSLTDN